MSKKKNTNKKSSRLMRILTLPIRVLIKAKDNYVNSMNNFAAPTNYGNFMGLPGAAPRSSSVKSSTSSVDYDNEDLRELIRSASVSATSGALSRNSSTNSNDNSTSTSSMSLTEIYMIKRQLQEMKQSSSMGSRKQVPRSFSVGMGKIDEDEPCDDFREDKKGKKSTTKPNLYSSTGTEFMYPRSKSHAVARRNVVF